jgi:hypothetical protein
VTLDAASDGVDLHPWEAAALAAGGFLHRCGHSQPSPIRNHHLLDRNARLKIQQESCRRSSDPGSLVEENAHVHAGLEMRMLTSLRLPRQQQSYVRSQRNLRVRQLSMNQVSAIITMHRRSARMATAILDPAQNWVENDI